MRAVSRKNVVLILLIGLIAWWVQARYFYSIENARPQGKNIIVFGDSLAAGYGVPPDRCYVSLLSMEFDLPIINAGVPGDSTVTALRRLEDDVLRRDPKVVIIELGGNDLLYRLPQSQTRRNLREMITRAQDAGAAVVLVAVQAPFDVRGLGKLCKELARKNHAVIVPNILGGIMGDRKLMTDEVHPNSEGHRIMADRIARQLKKDLPAVFQ